MSAPLRWYDHNADNPPWLKALAEVRIRATREGWCHAHVKLVVAIDQYAEAALGNWDYFLNKPHSIGRSNNSGRQDLGYRYAHPGYALMRRLSRQSNSASRPQPQAPAVVVRR